MVMVTILLVLPIQQHATIVFPFMVESCKSSGTDFERFVVTGPMYVQLRNLFVKLYNMDKNPQDTSQFVLAQYHSMMELTKQEVPPDRL